MSKDVKRGLRNSILLPTLTYVLESWTCNGAQQSRMLAIETSCLRGMCGVIRCTGLSNEGVMRDVASGVEKGWGIVWLNR